MEKQVEIKIKPDGSLTVELLGFQGDGCSKTAQRIIDALGKTVNSDRKSEYYEDSVKNQECNKKHTGQ